MIGLVQIPRASEAMDAKGVYTTFDVHINGCYHGSFRYSQLLAFHQEVKAMFNVTSLEEFPSKHWFGSLSPDQLWTRRIGLERYLHSLCQDRTVGTSECLKEFLLAMQKASTDVSLPSDAESAPSGEVQVYLVNGKSVSVNVGLFDRTDQVLERVCSEIQLASQLTYYFGLFLEKEGEESGTWTVTRSLTDFECPYLTLHTISKSSPHRIAIRKNFWDPVLLPELVGDRVAKNLLYIEALACVSLDHWHMTPDGKKNLSVLQRKGQKKEYIEMVGMLPQYGFLQLDGLTLDHPREDVEGFVRVGKLEIVSYTRDDADTATFTYPLTKIRSWKLGGKPGSPWLKFFFQQGVGDFTPVSVVGPQTILLSHCLHSVVDELLRVRAKKEIRQPSTQPIVREPRELPKIVFYESPESVESAADAHSTTSSTETGPDVTPPTSPPDSTHTPHEPLEASVGTKRLSSIGESEQSKTEHSKTEQSKTDSKTVTKQVKAPKKKSVSLSDVENPTFAFGTDDDL